MPWSSEITREPWSRAGSALLLAALAGLCIAIGGCGKPDRPAAGGGSGAALLARLSDGSASSDERVERILAEARPENFQAVLPLLRVLKDRSQINFLPERDDSAPFGYRALEFKRVEAEDRRALERAMAAVALEHIGSAVALPDLVAALSDRSPWVRNHAARALLAFGVRAGVPVLLANLGEKAEANETACRILREVSGREFGFSPDIGWKAKQAAIARWRAWWQQFRSGDELLRGEARPYDLGRDPEADARILFFTDVMGQFQKKYSEEARSILMRMGVVAMPFLRRAVDRARTTANHPLAAAVATVLGGLDDPRATDRARQLLLELLSFEGQGAVRTRAARALAARRDRAAVPELVKALQDPDLEVRMDVLDALGRLGGDAARAALGGFSAQGVGELEEARQLALFEASGGREGRERVLAWVRTGTIPQLNAACEVLNRVTGHAETPDPAKGAPERRRVAEVYESLLKN